MRTGQAQSEKTLLEVARLLARLITAAIAVLFLVEEKSLGNPGEFTIRKGRTLGNKDLLGTKKESCLQLLLVQELLPQKRFVTKLTKY